MNISGDKIRQRHEVLNRNLPGVVIEYVRGPELSRCWRDITGYDICQNYQVLHSHLSIAGQIAGYDDLICQIEDRWRRDSGNGCRHSVAANELVSRNRWCQCQTVDVRNDLSCCNIAWKTRTSIPVRNYCQCDGCALHGYCLTISNVYHQCRAKGFTQTCCLWCTEFRRNTGCGARVNIAQIENCWWDVSFNASRYRIAAGTIICNECSNGCDAV